ncbi:hypothetical protein R3F64_01405 [Halomonas sp. 5021]|uniref:hypothetical protein n=1 Tax=Halomonas sp. 5021 TaxID=3082156 RepID=UPI002FC585A1
MKKIASFPESAAMAKTHPTPSLMAQFVIKSCGRDIYVNQASGPMVRISWLDDHSAWKAWSFIEAVQRDAGDAISKAVRSVSINHDDTAATVFVDHSDLDKCGAQMPDSLAWMTRFDESPYFVQCVVKECES